MWALIICNNDNSDCKITMHETRSDALNCLREKCVKVWRADLDGDPLNEETATILSRKNLWTFEEMQDWFTGENDINTIHLKEIKSVPAVVSR